MRSWYRGGSLWLSLTVLAVAGLALLAIPTPVQAASEPTPPLGFDREVLSNLSAPSIGPGGSATLSFRLSDPASFFPLAVVSLDFDVYAFNGYPGNSVVQGPLVDAPVLDNGSVSGPRVDVSLSSLAPGTSYSGAVTVLTSVSTPAGTYAIRTELSFRANNSDYLFKSRGWFNDSTWENATTGPGGSATLNLTRLGVSGVVPETAVYVAPSDWPFAIGALIAVGLILVGVGGWAYFRKGPGSRGGTANDPAPGATNAPSAFGTSRKSPGDSRNS